MVSINGSNRRSSLLGRHRHSSVDSIVWARNLVVVVLLVTTCAIALSFYMNFHVFSSASIQNHHNGVPLYQLNNGQQHNQHPLRGQMMMNPLSNPERMGVTYNANGEPSFAVGVGKEAMMMVPGGVPQGGQQALMPNNRPHEGLGGGGGPLHDGQHHHLQEDEESSSSLQILQNLGPIPYPDLVGTTDTYTPAVVEKYVIENGHVLGYDKPNEWVSGCNLWHDKDKVPYAAKLDTYVDELHEYNRLVHEFQSPVSDIRKHLNGDNTNDEQQQHGICDELELHPDGLLEGVFNSSKQLSFTDTSGYVEPLLPPMRHPGFCYHRKQLLDLTYIVHDFAHMCRNLKSTARTVLIDMGASLSFHSTHHKKPDAFSTNGEEEKQQRDHHEPPQPAVYLIDLYKKFGLPFDHIYAFEVTPTSPAQVFEAVPDELLTAYHWINVGVTADPNSKMNPLRWILDKFDQDDLVIVKLDIDTPAIELPLAMQLLNDVRYHENNLIDQFYFEHHVHLKELQPFWGSPGMQTFGTVQDSLNLFTGLRSKGIPAHFWV